MTKEFSVEKLKGAENYHEWSFAMENYLASRTFDLCIVPSDDDTTVAMEKNAGKLSQSKAQLALSVEPKLFVHIRTCKTALEIWNKFKSMYEDRGLLRKIGLLRGLMSIRLESSESMQHYIDNITSTVNKLDGIGFTVNDEWIAAILLAGLTDEFKPLIMSFEARSDEISADDIKLKLLDTQTGNTASNENAFYSKGKGKFNSKRTFTCYSCGGKKS